jgi:hypothetical protein
MSGLDKILISDMMEGFVTESPPIPFVSYCVVCKVFLTKDEMIYEKGHVFHKDCFEQHGKDFPIINQDLVSQNTNAKLQLIQLKNLKIRQLEQRSSKKPRSISRKSKKKSPKRKKLAKRKKKTTKSKRRTSTKKRKTKRKIRRPSRRRTTKRRAKRRR